MTYNIKTVNVKTWHVNKTEFLPSLIRKKLEGEMLRERKVLKKG